MSLLSALKTMYEGNLVIHNDTPYAVIDERLAICRFNEEENTIEYHQEVHSDFYLLSMLFDNFSPHHGINVFKRPPVPESYVIEDGQLYDFGKLLEVICPVCQVWCGRETVYRIGRFAHCPGCNRRYWKAVRYDGTRDDPIPRQIAPKAEKPEKPKPPTNDEIIEQLLATPNKEYKRKIAF